jgi:hypothetical protein
MISITRQRYYYSVLRSMNNVCMQSSFYYRCGVYNGIADVSDTNATNNKTLAASNYTGTRVASSAVNTHPSSFLTAEEEQDTTTS